MTNSTARRRGVVVNYDERRRFGFIREAGDYDAHVTNRDRFFHGSQVEGPFVFEQDRVTFETAPGEPREQAVRVRLEVQP